MRLFTNGHILSGSTVVSQKTLVAVLAALSLSFGVTACQKTENAPATVEENTVEEVAPMSAEPAETEEVLIVEEGETDPDASTVAEQTVADIGTVSSEMSYRCAPELAINASYQDDDNSVTLNVAGETVVLENENIGSNPMVFSVEHGLQGATSGMTQWRVAHANRKTGTLRTSADGENITTYECKSGE